MHDFIKRKFTAIEIIKFLVLTVAMGIVSFPSLQQYWSTSWPFHSYNFNKIMARDRFLLLLQFFHLADNSASVPRGSPGFDKLYKLRRLITMLTTKFKTTLNLSRELAIDESIIGFKGRLSFLQYMPKKPTKWGMKAWVLSDSHTGYVWNWRLYTGKEESKELTTPLAEHVVLDLLVGLENRGHHVYFDNYYTSIPLSMKLSDLGFGSCGTVRINRKGIPKDFQTCKLKKGEVVTFCDGTVSGLKWMDKRPVSMLSTIHDDSLVSKRRRTKQIAGGVEEIQKPLMVEMYNTYMGGVDRGDQLVVYYAFSHATKKWWKRAFFHLMEVAMVNAYIVYCKSTPTKRLSHLEFRIAVATGLLQTLEAPTPARPLSSPSEAPLRLTNVGMHFPEPAHGRPDCKVCSDRSTGNRKQTNSQCKVCKIALCPFPCFEKFHTLKKYK